MKAVLVLPTKLPGIHPGRYGAARQIHSFLIAVSALVLFTGTISLLYRLGLHGAAAVSLAGLVAAARVFGFDRWYVTDERTTIRNIWERCPAVVHEEIAERAYEIFAARQDSIQSGEQDWKEAERDVRRRWGLEARPPGRSVEVGPIAHGWGMRAGTQRRECVFMRASAGRENTGACRSMGPGSRLLPSPFGEASST